VLIMNCIHDVNTVRYVTGLEAMRVYAEYGTFATLVENERCHDASLLVRTLPRRPVTLTGTSLYRAVALPWRVPGAHGSGGTCLLVRHYRCCDHRAVGAPPPDRRMGVAQDVEPQPGQQR
jgi:hypothetical protein